jgi:hypothetical protein
MARELTELIDLLESGEGATDEDLAQALAFAEEMRSDIQKGVRTIRKSSSKSDDEHESDSEEEDDQEYAGDAGDGDSDDDDDSDDSDSDSEDEGDEEGDEEPEPKKVQKSVRKPAAKPAKQPVRKSVKPAAKADDEDEEGLTDLAKSISELEGGEEVLDAIPIIGEMVEAQRETATVLKSLRGMLRSQGKQLVSLQAQFTAQAEANAALQKSLKRLTAPPAEKTRVQAQEALAKSLRDLQEKYSDLEEAVSRRPSSPHPKLGKSVGNGTHPSLTKDEAVDVIEKALDANKITRTEAARATAMFDIAQRDGTPFGEVIRKAAPGATELYKSMLAGVS